MAYEVVSLRTSEPSSLLNTRLQKGLMHSTLRDVYAIIESDDEATKSVLAIQAAFLRSRLAVVDRKSDSRSSTKPESRQCHQNPE